MIRCYIDRWAQFYYIYQHNETRKIIHSGNKLDFTIARRQHRLTQHAVDMKVSLSNSASRSIKSSSPSTASCELLRTLLYTPCKKIKKGIQHLIYHQYHLISILHSNGSGTSTFMMNSFGSENCIYFHKTAFKALLQWYGLHESCSVIPLYLGPYLSSSSSFNFFCR